MKNNLSLELILHYRMNEMEAKAWKIACVYLEKERKMFPNYQHYRVPKGDPRKSELFRYCHTLVRKTQGKLLDQDYKLYVHAQLDILRNITKGDGHPRISPSCLVGDKAWRRWLLWKSRYDLYVENRDMPKGADVHTIERIKKSLHKTKLFLIAWFDRYDPEDVKQSLEDKTFFHWYRSGSVCGYFVYLSPIVKEWVQKNKIDLKSMNINLDFPPAIDHPEVFDYFKKEFM